MATIYPGLVYSYDSVSQTWAAPGYEPLLATVPFDRSSLVPGEYIPGIEADSVGIVNPGAVFTTIGDGTSTYTITGASPTFNNVIFKCAVVTGTGITGTVTMNNCAIYGNNPDVVQASRDTGGSLSANGFSNFRNVPVVITDSIVDNGWWWEQGLSSQPSTQFSNAFEGGNFTLNRVEAKRWTDIFHHTAASIGVSNANLVTACWLHACNFENGLVATPYYTPNTGGYTHSDGVQLLTGPNIEVRYSYIGGPLRNSEVVGSPIKVITSGARNAAVMIAQGADSRYSGAALNLANANIHDNWLAGGAATVNLAVANGNDLAGVSVTNNRIMRRLTGQNDSGYQILKTTGVNATITGNVEWDPAGSIFGTGVASTITTI